MAKIHIEQVEDHYGYDTPILTCGKCGATIMELDVYENRRGSLNTKEDNIQNKWYIPQDGYNQEIEYCSCCGSKLAWKTFYLKGGVCNDK